MARSYYRFLVIRGYISKADLSYYGIYISTFLKLLESRGCRFMVQVHPPTTQLFSGTNSAVSDLVRKPGKALALAVAYAS